LSGYRPKDYFLNFIKNIFKLKNENILRLEDATINKLIFTSFLNYKEYNKLFKIIPIKLNKYSLIFNLYLNIMDIKED